VPSRSRKAANDALVSSVNLEREAIGSEFTQLGSLSARIKEGQGQGHQLQVANALASTQVHQMMKLRSMMVVSEAARAAEAQVAAEKDARAIAVSKHMRAGLDGVANPHRQGHDHRRRGRRLQRANFAYLLRTGRSDLLSQSINDLTWV